MSLELSPDHLASAPQPPGTRVRSGSRPPAQRSAVSNGARIFAKGGDGRSAWVRRWQDLIDGHIADLGGPAHVSEAQLSLCKRASTIEVQLEQFEARMSEGDETVDLDLFNRLTGNLRRMLESLGLRRVAKDVSINPLAQHFSRPPVRD